MFIKYVRPQYIIMLKIICVWIWQPRASPESLWTTIFQHWGKRQKWMVDGGEQYLH